MYQAIVSTAESIRPIEGADRIIAATVLGNEVVLSINTKVGDLGVFFPEDGIFQDEFCEKNDLFPIYNENNVKVGGGFFTRGKARIRAQKFKSVKSCGFWCPLSYLKYTKYDISKLKEGDKFNELNKVKICDKYYTPATLRAQANIAKNGKKQPRTISFPEHVDSLKFQYEFQKIKKGDLISATCKMHGCVEKNTIINTKEFGDLKIKEIVDKKLKVHVLAYDIEKQKNIYAKVNDYYFYANDEDWYEIELENGKKITITGNNPVWLPELECYRKVQDLNINDILLTN